ncbi:MAG: hypothetical protein JNM14_14085 [Ferruginibacter sp.]|nr:hypothetical protein [Ferruginibacter sp.]
MIFKKDNFIFGAILGFIGPLIGIIIFKMTKFKAYSFSDTFNFMLFEETGHRTLSVALSLSLLVNAVLFTVYINTRKDNTAKGIFVLTLIYGLIVLSIKTFS